MLWWKIQQQMMIENFLSSSICWSAENESRCNIRICRHCNKLFCKFGLMLRINHSMSSVQLYHPTKYVNMIIKSCMQASRRRDFSSHRQCYSNSRYLLSSSNIIVVDKYNCLLSSMSHTLRQRWCHYVLCTRHHQKNLISLLKHACFQSSSVWVWHIFLNPSVLQAAQDHIVC